MSAGLVSGSFVVCSAHPECALSRRSDCGRAVTCEAQWSVLHRSVHPHSARPPALFSTCILFSSRLLLNRAPAAAAERPAAASASACRRRGGISTSVLFCFGWLSAGRSRRHARTVRQDEADPCHGLEALCSEARDGNWCRTKDRMDGAVRQTMAQSQDCLDVAPAGQHMGARNTCVCMIWRCASFCTARYPTSLRWCSTAAVPAHPRAPTQFVVAPTQCIILPAGSAGQCMCCDMDVCGSRPLCVVCCVVLSVAVGSSAVDFLPSVRRARQSSRI
jgi:hypothetical protein